MQGKADWRRLKYAQKWFPHYSYQHLWFPILYGLVCTPSKGCCELIYCISPNNASPILYTALSMKWAGDFTWIFNNFRLYIPTKVQCEDVVKLKKINDFAKPIASTIQKNSNTVGHLPPSEISWVCTSYRRVADKLHHQWCCVTGDNLILMDGEELGVPCIYVFRGNENPWQAVCSANLKL